MAISERQLTLEQFLELPERKPALEGVPLALLVDPHDQSVIAFRPDRPAVALRGDDQIDFSEIIPGLRLAIQELFSWLFM